MYLTENKSTEIAEEISLSFGSPLKSCIFKKRNNRFVAEVIINNKVFLAHVPSSGRMMELLFPGAEVFAVEVRSPKRKLPYKLVVAKSGVELVCIDSLMPNRLIKLALEKKALPEFSHYDKITAESVFGDSRFDFCLEKDETDRCYIEVKSVTLVENSTALFPDAPSARGRKHLEELLKIKEAGFKACVIFVIQRNDAEIFKPNVLQDKKFAELLKKVHSQGVELFAIDCIVSMDKITLNKRIPVKT